MRATRNVFFIKFINRIAVITAILISTAIANNASATLINFDDLNPVHDPDFPCWCDNPLTDQYATQGVLFNGGAWVNGGDSNNVMTIGSGGASIIFTGVLPTFVSMNVTSLQDDAIYLEAYGTSGFLEAKQTKGWFGFEDGYIPSVPNELISFTSDVGISSIAISGFYNLRVEADIDNLTFGVAAVPEPSSIILLCFGLMGIALRKLKK